MTEKKAKFERYQDVNLKYRFRLKAPNGKIIATSEAYETKTACGDGVAAVQLHAPGAELVDV